MRAVQFLAFKNITGNKKKSFFIVLIVSVTLMMSLIVTVVKENLFIYDVQMLKVKNGSWHFIVPVSNEDVKKDILSLDCVSDVAVVRRTLVLQEERESYDCFLTKPDDLELLISGDIIGSLPWGKGEVLVPDWYLNKYSVTQLPCPISVGGLNLCITGAYITETEDVYNEKIRLYFGSAELTELFNSATYEHSPVGSFILEGGDSTFAFVRVCVGSNIDEAIRSTVRIPGVSSFTERNDATGYLKDGALRNEPLLEAEGYISTSGYGGNFISNHLAQIITGIMLIILFISIFIAMNLIVSGDVRLCGILKTLGMSKNSIIFIYLLQALFLCILSIPLGGVGGIVISHLLLKNTLAKIYGTFLFPWDEMLLCLFSCVGFVIMAALAPAIKASRISCVDAIYGRALTGERELEGYNSPAFLNIKSKFSFVWHYSIRNIAVNKKKILALMMTISLLLSVFILIAYQIEALWRKGNGRRAYKSDFTIGYDGSPESENKFIDERVVEKIKEIDGIEQIYFQYSIGDAMIGQNEGMYNYYFVLHEDSVTEQAYKQLNLSAPVARAGYDGKLFVQAGISGYDVDGLELAADYLIEGNISMDEMRNHNIILLPKYILWLENMDIPYTNLKVGDQITIAENKTESLLEMDIVKEYTFTIGGFVDALPMPQVNGVINGFVAMMYFDKLDQFKTSYKGIKEVYIDGKMSGNAQAKLEMICRQNGLVLTDNTLDFKQQEQQEKQNLLIYAFYSVFAVLGAVLFLAIFYILLSNITLRTREFSLLHIVGTQRWQRNLSIILEMLSFTIPGLIVGDCVGILFILGGDRSGEFLKLSQIIPYVHILISNAMVLAATASSAIIGIAYISKNISVNLEQI